MCMCICVYIPMYIYHICSIFWSLVYLDTTDTRRSIWCSKDNAKPHENRRSNPWAYTPSWIKALFPLNQCISSFGKFMSIFIKTYTFQCNQNVIHNLSDHTLTKNEFSVLAKGLSFVSTPTKTFKQETNKSWDKTLPLHPIASGCDSSTDHLSAYITHFIQTRAGNLPSHIKHKKHFPNFI